MFTTHDIFARLILPDHPESPMGGRVLFIDEKRNSQRSEGTYSRSHDFQASAPGAQAGPSSLRRVCAFMCPS